MKYLFYLAASCLLFFSCSTRQQVMSPDGVVRLAVGMSSNVSGFSPEAIEDSIDALMAKGMLTPEDYSKIKELRDSLTLIKPVDGIAGPFEINFLNHFSFHCAFSFTNLKEKGHERFLPWHAYVVDTLTNDTIPSEIVGSRCVVISNPPLIAVTSLDFVFQGQVFTVFSTFDHRAKDRLNDSESHRCFRIK